MWSGHFFITIFVCFFVENQKARQSAGLLFLTYSGRFHYIKYQQI